MPCPDVHPVVFRIEAPGPGIYEAALILFYFPATLLPNPDIIVPGTTVNESVDFCVTDNVFRRTIAVYSSVSGIK